MDSAKTKRIVYWVTTLLVLLPTAGTAGPELFAHGSATTMQAMHVLGYPLYMLRILGLAKILGAITLLLNRPTRMVEWAYAGFAFLLLGATASHLLAGDYLHAPIPFGFFLVLLLSYAFHLNARGASGNSQLLKVFILIGGSLMTSTAQAATLNQVLGTWRMVSAEIDHNGKREPAYGKQPSGLLVFTSDMHYVEVLTQGTMPRFASDARGQGTDAENRKAMASSIGMFGTYTVDESGEFSGNQVEGSTLPNWIGDVRTRKELMLHVEGNRMTEHFERPGGVHITITYQRVR